MSDNVHPSGMGYITPHRAKYGAYDGDLQMYKEDSQEPNIERLVYLRMECKAGRGEHDIAGPSCGQYAEQYSDEVQAVLDELCDTPGAVVDQGALAVDAVNTLVQELTQKMIDKRLSYGGVLTVIIKDGAWHAHTKQPGSTWNYDDVPLVGRGCDGHGGEPIWSVEQALEIALQQLPNCIRYSPS